VLQVHSPERLVTVRECLSMYAGRAETAGS